MALEIERKFRVLDDRWRKEAVRRQRMSQGYVVTDGAVSVRVRVAGERAWMTIKGGGSAAVRHEFEYSIPAADAADMLEIFCGGKRIEKTRYRVDDDGLEWEIDEFHGANDGLVVAEVELDDERQPFRHPPWLGREVTHLARYYNINLIDHPFERWSDSEREE